jgi:hypothetical protein
LIVAAHISHVLIGEDNYCRDRDWSIEIAGDRVLLRRKVQPSAGLPAAISAPLATTILYFDKLPEPRAAAVAQQEMHETKRSKHARSG